MNHQIVRSSAAITLVGGGEVNSDALADSLRLAPLLVAADGGADFALHAGRCPDHVIGDMDSLSAAARELLPPEIIHQIADQDSTDFDKALRSITAPLVLGVGFLGRRVDHQLANFNVLVRQEAQPCILIGKHDVVFAAPRRLKLQLPAGSRVSLFPLAPVEGRSKGLQWPIDGLPMAPGGVVGTSNRVADGYSDLVELEFNASGALVILPREALSEVVSALMPG